MATDEFQVVMQYIDAAEAEHLRGVLQEHGIQAFVEGDDLNTALSFLGTAIGGVRLLVRAAELERAREVIDTIEEIPDDGVAAWYCGECQELVDGGFQVCWSCGRERGDVEQAPPASTSQEVTERELPQEIQKLAVPGLEVFFEAQPDNPYSAPQAESDAEKSLGEATLLDDEAEAMLRRAWRAAIIGIVLFPPLLQFYSMYLLIRASIRARQFTPEGDRRFVRAMMLNGIVACVAIANYWFVLL